MFAIAIRYLNGWAMATDPADRTRPEWPPHPDRVFMALAAAHFETGADPAERTALEWLEKQNSLAIAATDCQERAAVTTYVPANDMEISRKGSLDDRLRKISEIENLKVAKERGLGLLPEHRNRNARNFPVALPDDPTVHFVWREADPSHADAVALAGLCLKMTSVGHSASLVHAWVEEHPPDITLEPVAGPARHRLRIFGPGRLRQLEQLYGKDRIEAYRLFAARFKQSTGKQQKELRAEMRAKFGDSPPVPQRPRPALWQGYDHTTKERTPIAVATTVFSESFLVLRRKSGPLLPLESTLQLTKAVRDAFFALCPVQPPPEWLSGHTAQGAASQVPHASFFPLPDVGHDHADGHIMGVGIAVPRAVAPAERNRCFRDVLFDSVGRPQTVRVTMGRLGVWEILLAENESRPVAFREETWTSADGTEGARRWATVTPITFDRHPNLSAEVKAPLAKLPAAERKACEQALLAEQAEKMIKEACGRVGLPAPLEVALTPVSCYSGAPHARSFACIQRKAGGSLHHTHALLIFPAPVAGPMLLGAGRYRGYGLCRPLRDGGGV